MVQISIDRSSKLEKEKVKNALNFAYSFRPIYYISRVFGLIPYIFHDKTGAIHRPRIRLSDFFWLIISLSIHIGFTIYCIRDAKLPKKNHKHCVLQLFVYVIESLSLIFGAIMIIMDMCNRIKLVNIFQKINDFDETV